MSLISDNHQQKKLEKYAINIKTKYIVGKKILERNTDNTHNDDIKQGIRFLKEYYLKKELVHTEKEFDTRIEYTFISKEEEDKDYTCPNCGAKGKVKEFTDGCPYCNTYYNIDYIDKDLGSKYHYDRVLRSNKYRIITLIIDIIISLIISLIYIKSTSRTFNNIDIIKVIIYGIILSLILYYFFYIIDAYVILGPIKRFKDRENQKQKEFWERTKIDKKKFFNNFNYEIRKYYYNKDNIIDYDLLDYIEFNDYIKNDLCYVNVTVEVRLVYYENNKIYSKIVKDKFTLVKHDKGVVDLKGGVNLIKCPGCGSSIDVTKGKCEYCGTEIKYLQEWIMVNKEQ